MCTNAISACVKSSLNQAWFRQMTIVTLVKMVLTYSIIPHGPESFRAPHRRLPCDPGRRFPPFLGSHHPLVLKSVSRSELGRRDIVHTEAARLRLRTPGCLCDLRKVTCW